MSNFIGGVNLNTMDEINSFLNGYKKAEKTDSVDSFLKNMRNTEAQRYAGYTNTTDTLSGSTSNIDADTTQKGLDSLSEDYTNIEGLKPTDISYEDYKKLTYEALEVIFHGDGKKIGPASGLMKMSQLTNDNELNKIYFDEEITAQKKGELNKYNFTLAMVSLMYKNLDVQNGISINTSDIPDSNDTEQLYTTKDKLFLDFDKFKQFYQDTKENWTNAIDINEVFKNMNEIQSLYNQKIEENNTILNSLIKNNKQQVL